jgi:hypothetical protein
LNLPGKNLGGLVDKPEQTHKMDESQIFSKRLNVTEYSSEGK